MMNFAKKQKSISPGVYIVNFNHFFSTPPLRDPFFFPNFREARRADTSPRPEGPSHLGGGPGGRGPPENFLKIGFRMVLFQSNFLRMRRNIAAYNTLYTYSSLLSIFSDTPSRPAGPRHHRGRRAKPFGGSGGPWPPGKFFENRV